MMKNMDQAALREWIDLELDGDVSSGMTEQLRDELSRQPELQRERQALRSLHGMFHDAKIDVRPHFAEQVVEALPKPAWDTAQAPGRVPVWALPVAMVVLLATASSLMFSSSASGQHMWETGMMLADLMKTSVLAGSGLLFATWRGVGFGVEEMVADSTLNLAAFGVLVLCLNLLFVSMLRRRRAAVVPTSDSTRS